MGSVKGKIKATEVCHAFMETILWHIVDPMSESLNHGSLCRQSAVEIEARGSIPFLKDLWILCSTNNCPNLASIVLNQRSHLPGDWYFDLYEAINPEVSYQRTNHYKEEVEKVYSYMDWHTLALKYNLSESLILKLSLRNLKLKQLDKQLSE